MMKGGIGALMKQAQQMQENMRKAQEELATVLGKHPQADPRKEGRVQ